MKRVVFLPDRPLDRNGDLFFGLIEKLGLTDFEIEGDPASADIVAFVGRARAAARLGERVKSGPTGQTWEGAEIYVLPSTAPEERRRFYEGTWRSFASHVLGRDLAVRDEFKGMAPETIKALLDLRRFDFGVLCANLVYDFNLGSVVRSANAFLAREVCIFGRKKADLRGAMGAYHYLDLVHLADAGAFHAHVKKRAYTTVCFEQTGDAVALQDFIWPKTPLMIFGQEGPGVPGELLEGADHVVVIPQFGSMRSLNAGVAAGIAMWDWHAKTNL